MYTQRINKSCDQCRARKVRCTVPPNSGGSPASCTHCLQRNEACQFSNLKRKIRVRHDSQAPSPSPLTSASLANCFVDHLFQTSTQNESSLPNGSDHVGIVKMNSVRVPSSGLAFFSDRKLDTLEQIIGSPRLRVLVNEIEKALNSQILTRTDAKSPLHPSSTLEQLHATALLAQNQALRYVQHYFTYLHPIYPFLERVEFEEKIRNPGLRQNLKLDSSFAALYYATLALGCQYEGNAAATLENGKSWAIFQVSLSYLPDILLSRKSLTSLQALTAMSIYSMNTLSLQLDSALINYASTMAMALQYHRMNSDNSTANHTVGHKTFWVIYCLEKHYRFQGCRNSVIADCDIACRVPKVSESIFGDYDWILASARFGRILSIAYESLFSITASQKSADSQLVTIDQLRELLEEWRKDIPSEFRPREPVQAARLTDSIVKQVIVRTHYYYYNLVIALERMSLYINTERGRRWEESKLALLNAARTVIELAHFIEIASYTPVFIMSTMPLAALFILFEFVIHNPAHPDVRRNLILLDIVSGHFSLVEHASNGSHPTGYLSEFAQIAKDYVRDRASHTGDGSTNAPMHDTINPPEQEQEHLSKKISHTYQTSYPVSDGLVDTTSITHGSQSGQIQHEVIGSHSDSDGKTTIAETAAEACITGFETFNDLEYLYYPTPEESFTPFYMRI